MVGLIARGQQLGTLTVGRRARHLAAHAKRSRSSRTWPAGPPSRSTTRGSTPSAGTVAQALQRSLLPPRLPKVEGIEFGAEYVPTGEAVDVGGDFYDVVPLSERRWLVVVGDVSGKGVQAATVTGLVRDVTRVLVRDGRPLPEVLTRLNETLRRARQRPVLHPVPGRRHPPLGQPARCHAAPGRARPAGAPPRQRHDVGRRDQYGTALGLLDTVKSPATRVPLRTRRHADLLHRRGHRTPARPRPLRGRPAAP